MTATEFVGKVVIEVLSLLVAALGVFLAFLGIYAWVNWDKFVIYTVEMQKTAHTFPPAACIFMALLTASACIFVSYELHTNSSVS